MKLSGSRLPTQWVRSSWRRQRVPRKSRERSHNVARKLRHVDDGGCFDPFQCGQTGIFQPSTAISVSILGTCFEDFCRHRLLICSGPMLVIGNSVGISTLVDISTQHRPRAQLKKRFRIGRPLFISVALFLWQCDGPGGSMPKRVEHFDRLAQCLLFHLKQLITAKEFVATSFLQTFAILQ
jgi:hypothetical protein